MIEQGKVTEIEQRIEIQARSTRSILIHDSDSYGTAAARLVDIKGVRKQVDEMFDPAVKAAYESHRKMVALKRQFTDRLDTVERDLKGRMISYQNEQKRIADERESQLRESLRKKEEEEKLATAIRLEETGDKEGADAVMQEEVVVPSVIVQPDIPQTDGISTRKVWKFRIVDAAKIPAQFLCVDEKKLGAYARSMRETAAVPGVEFYAEETMAVRGQ